MSYKLDVELSSELEPYRNKIEATIKPYIEIKLTNNDKPTWWQSKFGGLPYLPKDFEYPKSWDGKYLYLLAQINFTEVPHLEGYPRQGILQFYVSDDELYGLNLRHKDFEPDRFKILYFPEIDRNEDNLITDFSFVPEISDYFPLFGCCALKFCRKLAPISINDYQFDIFTEDEVSSGAKDEYYKLFSGDGHKIGGYPTFVQCAPRDLKNNEDKDILLLQIDSDGNNFIDIM